MHAGVGEELPELRRVDDITGPIVGAFSPFACEVRHVGKSRLWDLPHCALCPGHLETGT